MRPSELQNVVVTGHVTHVLTTNPGNSRL